LGALGHVGQAAVDSGRTIAIGLADFRVDLDEVSVDRPAIATADELDVAVRLVVAAVDERRVREGRDVPVDQRARRVGRASARPRDAGARSVTVRTSGSGPHRGVEASLRLVHDPGGPDLLAEAQVERGDDVHLEADSAQVTLRSWRQPEVRKAREPAEPLVESAPCGGVSAEVAVR
jgi:hypothetical protein